eukprot:11022677-Alexandrium_andersonii.AAC.1
MRARALRGGALDAQIHLYWPMPRPGCTKQKRLSPGFGRDGQPVRALLASLLEIPNEHGVVVVPRRTAVRREHHDSVGSAAHLVPW